MLGKLLRKVVGTKNQREIRRLRGMVERMKEYYPVVAGLTDAQLRAKTDEFRRRYEKGETLDELMYEAFPVVREAAYRVFNDPETVTRLFGSPDAKRYHLPIFDVQMMGGIVLHEGKIAEMATGEGKTLVATLAAYLNALPGKGVHVVTVNDYLARRDATWMGAVYQFLGLSVGYITHDMDPYGEVRKQAYAADITYGTNNEFGFDYLRDNMKIRPEDIVQRGHYYAIVDEVDSILIDEARTPLIISGPAEESTDLYYRVDAIVRRLEPQVHFTLDEKTKSAALTEAGVAMCEKLLGVPNLFDPANVELVHHINQALRAHHLFKRDVDYMIKDGEVVIVDEFTGRLMPGRRWSDGLHQAIEAKEASEGVRIKEENQTLATITFQNYFRMYEKLAGMTGTADTEAQEFREIYGLDVVVIPTNKPLRRTELPDVVYKTEQEKFEAVVEDICARHARGQPVLVGTTSIEKSERLSAMLRRRGIPHEVLNAKYHEREAEIVARAGQRYAVTIATNMAGRGTDIVLGEGVAELGGLHVLGTERHEARRIDNQLRGRSGRQGDPGSSQFYLSLEDDLMRIFASERIARIMERMGWRRGEPIHHPLLTRTIESAQKKVEEHNFEIRKRLLEYDNVMNRQREIVYEARRAILFGEDQADTIRSMIEEALSGRVELYLPPGAPEEEWDLDGFVDYLRNTYGVEFTPPPLPRRDPQEALAQAAADAVIAEYESRREALGLERAAWLERVILLQTIDSRWKDHLYAMDHLREGIGFRAYAERDPLVEYQREGFQMFSQMMDAVREEAPATIMRVFERQLARAEAAAGAGVAPRSVFRVASERHDSVSAFGTGARGGGPVLPSPAGVPLRAGGAVARGPMPSQGGRLHGEKVVRTVRREGPKVGRNDPCPCGSGKKYKKCCGR